jgi:hypothetical protein
MVNRLSACFSSIEPSSVEQLDSEHNYHFSVGCSLNELLMLYIKLIHTIIFLVSVEHGVDS